MVPCGYLVAVAAVAAPAGAGVCDQLSYTSSPFDAGDGPEVVAAGDLDGDGYPDLAVANVLSNDVSVLLNSGDGTFAVQTAYSTGARASSVAIGDVDGDDDLDLVVANFDSNNVTVLLNQGNGSFSIVQAVATGIGPVFAVPKLLQRFGLSMDDIDLWELNEAFAVQVIYCRDRLGIPDEKLNVDGGAISIGHPYGMSGARMVGHALIEGRPPPHRAVQRSQRSA